VIKLGKLGASMVAAVAKRGFKVIGVDVNQLPVNLVNAGQSPVQETDLEETIASNKERIQPTLGHQEAIINSDLSFVIVRNPSDGHGAFSLQYAGWVFEEIGRALKVKSGYHKLVITSPILPCVMRYRLLPVSGHESGNKCG
jgi:UDP-glucose 6-dehydrogenase